MSARISMGGASMTLDDRQLEAFDNLAFQKRGECERIVYAAGLQKDPASLEWAKRTGVRFAVYRTLVNAGLLFEEFPDTSAWEAVGR